MTTMETQKYHSNKAKSFYRFNGKRDHGTVANKREQFSEPTDKDGAFFDKKYLEEKGTPLEGFYDDETTPAELEAEANRILEAGEAKEHESIDPSEMGGRVLRYSYDPAKNVVDYDQTAFGDVSKFDDDEDQPEENVKERLGDLYRKAALIVKKLNELPRNATEVHIVAQKDELEGELEFVKAEIDQLEGNSSTPTDAEIGLWTKKRKEEYEQHKHDVNYDEDDDLGFDSIDSSMRSHKNRKSSL